MIRVAPAWLFCAPAGPKARNAVKLNKPLTTPSGRKTARPFGLCFK